MRENERIQQEVIDEFSSPVVQERYRKNAEKGLWESEKALIEQYFSANTSVLDVGCGSGRTTLPLYQMNYSVTGTDIAPAMISIANEVAAANGARIPYDVADAANLHFPDDSFDNALFENNGWSQIPGRDKRLQALQEIRRVIRPGGHFIFTAHVRYYDLRHLLLWAKQFARLYFFKPLGLPVKELEFGDVLYPRKHDGEKLSQKQFMHIGTVREIEELIQKAEFDLVYYAPLGEISTNDARNGRGTLFSYDNAHRSPVFFVCRKVQDTEDKQHSK